MTTALTIYREESLRRHTWTMIWGIALFTAGLKCWGESLANTMGAVGQLATALEAVKAGKARR